MCVAIESMYISIMSADLADFQVHSVGHFAGRDPVRTVRPDPADWLIVWATRGGISGTLGGQTFGVSGGIVMMPPGVAQDYRSPPTRDWEWLFAHAGGPALAGWRGTLGCRPTVELGMDAAIRGRWIDLVEQHRREPQFSAVRLAAIFADAAGSTTSDGEFTAVRRYVQEHLADPIGVADLAAVAGMSVPHFSRRFRAAAGTSPMRYVTGRRIARAKVLLRDTDQKLASIAAATGFVDAFHFSRVYKRETGRPPSAERG